MTRLINFYGKGPKDRKDQETREKERNSHCKTRAKWLHSNNEINVVNRPDICGSRSAMNEDNRGLIISVSNKGNAAEDKQLC